MQYSLVKSHRQRVGLAVPRSSW